MRYSLLAALTLLSFGLALTTQADDAPVVRVVATHQAFDPFQPWQKRTPGTRRGFGVVIDASHIVTTSSLVQNHTLIAIQLARSGEFIPASLVKTDPQVGLALLHISDTTQLPPPPVFADKVPVKCTVEIAQIDETSSIQRGDGRVLKVLVDALPGSPYSALQGDVLTDLNVDGEGAVVFHDTKLAGLMLSYSRTSRTGKMLSTSIISRFVQDALEGDYKGFASAGFSWKPLVDPTKRAFLGVGPTAGGIQVLNSLPGVAENQKLQPNDVVLTWDGYPIDNLGYYTDPSYGRLLFPQLIKGYRIPGDASQVTIVRDGVRQEIQVQLTHRDENSDLIPENVEGDPVPYLVEGGLVIRELTGRLLKAHGGQWQTRVDPRLAHLYLTSRYAPDEPGDRIVLLSSVLPDPINIGYQHFRDQIIKEVNGQPIRNIGDVFRIVEEDGSIAKLSLRAIDVPIVLDQASLANANERIASQYRLPALRSKAPKPCSVANN
ncbi:MAG: hypothetical protein HN341_12540 [Verrucomicrobia bacterium]|jgi:S1-C subfamily serine protease|nr:hypothetical protein [Verrucomicrobiota bacterium]